jgi:hypothetical protein
VKKSTARVTTPEPAASNGTNTTVPELTAKPSDTSIPRKPAHAAQKPTAQVSTFDSIDVEQLEQQLAVEEQLEDALGWEGITIPDTMYGFTLSYEEVSPERIRRIQANPFDFSALTYFGVPTETALRDMFRDPNRTAVDDIWQALQNRNRGLLLLAAKLHLISNLAQNEGFVAILQELQNRARKGDTWAKATLKAFGQALGVVGKGKTSAKTEPQRRNAKADS